MSEHDDEVEKLVDQVCPAGPDNVLGAGLKDLARRAVLRGYDRGAAMAEERFREEIRDLHGQLAHLEEVHEELREELEKAKAMALDNASHFAALGVLTATPAEAVKAAMPDALRSARIEGARSMQEKCIRVARRGGSYYEIIDQILELKLEGV